MSRIGVITIGQSPRSDMVPELATHWGNADIVEQGALDGFTATELSQVTIPADDEVLISRLRDGNSVVFGRSLIEDRLQASICAVENQNVDATLLVCTGKFPKFTHRNPLFFASPLLVKGVSALANGTMGIISPLAEQCEDAVQKFAGYEVVTAWANPYSASDIEIANATRTLVAQGATLIVLDCMGYTERQRCSARTASRGVPVVLARSLVARLVAEVIAA